MDDDDRIAKLLGLMSSDVEARLIRIILADLTPEEREVLKAAVVERVKERLPKMADAEIDKLVRGWVEPVAREAASKKWAATKRRIEDMVDARVEATLSEASMKPLLDQLVPPALHELVRGRMNGLLEYARKNLPR